MDFSELKEAWKQSTDHLDKDWIINQKLLMEKIIQKSNASLIDYRLESYIEIICYVFFLGWLFNFVEQNLFQVKFALPAISLIMYSFGSIAWAILKLRSWQKVNYAQDISSIQERLEKIRLYQLYEKNALLVLLPLFAVPLSIVVAKSFIGLDLFLFPSMIWRFTLGCLVVAMILTFILRLFPNRRLNEILEFIKNIKEED